MRSSGLILLGILAMAGCAPHVEPPEVDRSASQLTPQRQRFELIATLAADSYVPGDPVMLSVALRNISQDPTTIGVTHGPPDCRFVVLDSEGGVVPLTRYGTRERNRSLFSVKSVTIEPGQSRRHRAPIGRMFDVSLADTYTVLAIYKVAATGGETLTSNPVRFRMLDKD